MGRGTGDPWFRLGDIEVGSAALLALGSGISMIVWAIVPEFIASLALFPDAVRSGEFWRIVTWPLANSASIWTVIAVALLWLIGTQLEVQVGRVPMAKLLVATTIISGLLGTALDVGDAGVRSIEFVILLLYVAQHPHARFFFGIPGWVLGAVFVGIQVLGLVGTRSFSALLFFLLTLVVGAIAGRSVGLLQHFSFIPAVPSARNRRPKRKASRNNKGAPTRNHRGKVVEGPWSAPAPPSASNDAAAHEELDALLDKIHASGIDSLSKAEKQRLNDLSKRLR